MEFQEIIKKRYSVRAYKSDDIPMEFIEKIVESANLAPTSTSKQGYKVFVIKTVNFQEELKKIYRQEWFRRAPYVIGVCGKAKDCWVRIDGKNYMDVDAAIVMDHIILAATDLGLGTCWIAAFNPDTAREFLNLAPDMEPIVFTPIGYPADNPGIKSRKPISEIVHFIE